MLGSPDPKRRWRIYLIGYEPPGWPFDRDLAEQLIKGSDLCAMVVGPVAVGEELYISSHLTSVVGQRRVAFSAELALAKVPEPVAGRTLRVVELEHDGKVVIAEMVLS